MVSLGKECYWLFAPVGFGNSHSWKTRVQCCSLVAEIQFSNKFIYGLWSGMSDMYFYWIILVVRKILCDLELSSN